MRRTVIRIVLDGASQHPFRCRGLPLLRVGPAEQNVGSAVKRVEPQRLLQRSNSVIPPGLTNIGVSQLIVGGGTAGGDGELTRGQRNALVELPSEQRELPEQQVHLRKLWILRHRLFQFVL